MIVMIPMESGNLLALNLANVSTIEFEPAGATVCFNAGIGVEGQREGSIIFQPDSLRLALKPAQYLFKTLNQAEARPAYPREYPGPARKETP